MTDWIFEAAPGGRHEALLICAHGAGGHMADGGMTRAAQALVAAGFDVVRFNFAYREKGSRRPDPMPELKSRIVDVVSRAREQLVCKRLVIGGRSMGGRAASMLAADGFECDGLLLLAYPLHPAGKPEALRSEHLARIRVPVLCLNGTRDELCRRDLMDRAVGTLSWHVHWLEGADHSFRAGSKDVLDEVTEVSRAWLERLP